MIRRLIVWSCLAILTIFLLTDASAQSKLTGDDDYRITKFEGDIIQYVVTGSDRNSKTPFNIKDFESKISVWKCLELYSDTSNTRLLLIRFGLSGDDVPVFWGILTDKEKYLFSNPDDTTEFEALKFRKKYDKLTVSTVLFYCYQYPPDDFGFVPMASWVYGQNLSVIRDALYNKDGLTTPKIDSAISFLENITGIKPGSNRDNSGKYHLTRVDYTRWLIWVRENYSKLYWDKNKRKVKLKYQVPAKP